MQKAVIEPEVLQALEWPRFIANATNEAHSQTGKYLIQALANPLHWARDIEASRLLQLEMQEIAPLLDRDALWSPLTDLPDPGPTLERLERESILEIHELALLQRWLLALDSWSQFPRDEVRSDRFKKALALLADPTEPFRLLDRILTPEGELSEKASAKLYSIHNEIRSLKRDIGVTLDHLLKSLNQKGVLQESYSDLRDGRYVVPIKISAQNEVEGIVHEASASRQTVFIEPKEVAPLNNRLRQKQNDLIQEVYVILEKTSKELRGFCDEISHGVHILSHWDYTQARARMGRKYSGKPILVSEERSFKLLQTAHPLLWWSLSPPTIIRNDLEFGDPLRALLITGPNTGGKTVLLKTLGLAGICARTGFPFPATDRPVVPFFDSFFVDLGDPQSIEHHVSSFSGHVLHFKHILERMNAQSLVLIDELNSATDPEEGAALGRAVLESILDGNAMLVTTTHDPSLKALGASDKRILSASMAFDESAHTPTFSLVTGIPGRSRALDTAARLGLPKTVLERARTYLSKEHREFETLLAQLEIDTRDAARARKEAVLLKEESERAKNEWTQLMESNFGELLSRTRQKLRRILEQAQDEVRASVRRLDEARSRKDLDQARGKLNEEFTRAASHIDKALEEESPEIAHTLRQKQSELPLEKEERTQLIQVGVSVRVPKWKSIGQVLEIHAGKVKVAMGTVQMTLPLSDVEFSAPSSGSSSASVKTKFTNSPAAPDTQLDLRGVRLDDAMSQLEHYLDQAFRSGGPFEVTIIHGLGTGALREGARKLLKKLPYIKQFRDGGVGHGGSGATIVEFDRD